MKFIVNRWNGWMPVESTALERIIMALIALAPVFYLSIPHWITNISILSILLILASSIFYRNYFSVYKNAALLPFLCMFLVYFLSIFVSQLGRGVFVSKEYLDQTRWLLGIPFFAFLYYFRIDFSLMLRWCAPLVVIFAWISSTFFIPSDAWGDRATIEFMDPLAFGFMSLSVGLMCLVTAILDLRRGGISKLAVLNLVGFLVGLYISLRSGSRTGWPAFPFVLLLIAVVQFEKSTKGRIYSVLLLVLPLCVIALLSTTFRMRMADFVNEVSSYPWHGGVASDTSVGMRITFYRLGVYYFSESPWFGWGDRGYLVIKDAAEVLRFSTAYTRDFAYHALFHSEWTTQAVRFGVLGLFAVFWVFAVPVYFFFTRLRSHTHAALMGLAFLMCQLAASFSTEIYSSKGMITFSVVVVSGLLVSILAGNGNTDR
ncbi:O-antigen ligase family protein [Rhodoferax aquaticus]|uniref:O-antigen ligase family protein n=1 Tax=Rhodoferax aquaticus TaxID=2527691 RepID=A0A515ENS1_9BURK|nr:O-antigen ligase family protein [Rhodoferax aquaticus]QDL54294.1 O-antigen ligase family protein [Rhodoferax aquaticus]